MFDKDVEVDGSSNKGNLVQLDLVSKSIAQPKRKKLAVSFKLAAIFLLVDSIVLEPCHYSL